MNQDQEITKTKNHDLRVALDTFNEALDALNAEAEKLIEILQCPSKKRKTKAKKVKE
jgi:hypothetical protein